MPNTNHGIRRLSSTSSDVKGGGNTSQQDEIMEIHSQVLKMIEIFERMSAMLETIETRSKEQYLQASWALLLTVQQVPVGSYLAIVVTRPCTSANRNVLLPCGAHGHEQCLWALATSTMFAQLLQETENICWGPYFTLNVFSASRCQLRPVINRMMGVSFAPVAELEPLPPLSTGPVSDSLILRARVVRVLMMEVWRRIV
ncbi:hypothetical protein PAAG_04211 [Paracoccidioides lutzii Pb01]|uniref:Uncharacterized protein n=1 Tax=Paracoccidioides lutzii (strain ATCC MYA-826 / Pb01) TaxID=502779 RepID=C1H0B7_PARBA|nr:hypothetical protein PAAG_04211 [Paracoccidioides lutzii Pb01]EEH33158.1 hypothetical protein PAAG_04211 [Paracoccidioides lutzii Pb01]